MASSMSIKVVFKTNEAAQNIQQQLEERGHCITQRDGSQIVSLLQTSSMHELKSKAPAVLDELHTVSRVSSSTAAVVSSAKCSCSILCSSAREAQIICNSLQVDREPKRSNTKKVYEAKDQTCLIDVLAPDVRELRTATNSLLDLLALAVDTIARFGPPRPELKKARSPQQT